MLIFYICKSLHITLHFVGIIEKLHYLKFLKIDALILSPIYLSAMLDHGRDITDFRAVDHRYGTMKDFEQLVQDVHDKGGIMLCSVR